MITEIVYNLFGLSETLNWYSWFVFFYILSILSLPFLHLFYTKFPRLGWIVSIVVFYLLAVVIHFIPGWETNVFLHNIFTFTTLVPVVIVGYMCAKWNMNGHIPSWYEGKNRIGYALITILIVLCLEGLKLPTKGFCIQAFYTPFLVFAFIGIFNSFKLDLISKGLTKVGDLSMYMWFFHAIFFTTTVNMYTKNLVFEPVHNYFYTLVMTFVLTFAGSWCFKKILSPVINKLK